MILADADAEATASTLLGIATATISDTETGTFILFGKVTDAGHGFGVGVELYMSTTAGEMTATRPSGSGDIVRHIGTTLDANTIFFNPSGAYVEIA